MPRVPVTLLLVCAVGLTACEGNHSVFGTGGPRAQEIADLLRLFIGVSAAVYLIVIAVLVWAMLRRRTQKPYSAEEAAPSETRARLAVAGGLAATVVILIGLAVADFFVQRRLSHRPQDAIRVLITGHRYWWDIEYDDSGPSRRLRTANEFVIPVGRPVELVLTSRDVIHSFWLPSLRAALWITGAACAAASVAAGTGAAWALARAGFPPESSGIAPFMMRLAVGMSAIFALVILLSMVPISMLTPCPL
jgi:heme/copper-type cytochrome/quinol oxidase subunit 2